MSDRRIPSPGEIVEVWQPSATWRLRTVTKIEHGTLYLDWSSTRSECGHAIVRTGEAVVLSGCMWRWPVQS